MNQNHSWIKLCRILFKTMIQLSYGTGKVSRMSRPMVTIFGGSRLSQDSLYAQQAHKLSHQLVQSNISILTGGGSGIMQAANCAFVHEQYKDIKAQVLGIGVVGLNKEELVNPCRSEFIVVDYFFVRKWLLINFSNAFVIFPGGFGTLDEFAEVVMLVETKKMPGVPIVLVGKEYWQYFIDWMTKSALKNGLIIQEHLNLISITDDLYEVLCLVQQQCELWKDALYEIPEKNKEKTH